MCGYSLTCYKKIDEVIDKLENNSSIELFSESNQKYINLLFQLQAWQYEIKLNISDNLCRKSLLKFKEKVDHYLYINRFPLELDLNHTGWNKTIQYDEDFIEMSNRELFNIFSKSFFNPNENFPLPEYTKLGLLLGVIVDLSMNLLNS